MLDIRNNETTGMTTIFLKFKDDFSWELKEQLMTTATIMQKRHRKFIRENRETLADSIHWNCCEGNWIANTSLLRFVLEITDETKGVINVSTDNEPIGAFVMIKIVIIKDNTILLNGCYFKASKDGIHIQIFTDRNKRSVEFNKVLFLIMTYLELKTKVMYNAPEIFDSVKFYKVCNLLFCDEKTGLKPEILSEKEMQHYFGRSY